MGVVVSVCVWVCDCFDFFQFGYGYVVVFDLGVVMWFFLWFVVNGGLVGG